MEILLIHKGFCIIFHMDANFCSKIWWGGEFCNFAALTNTIKNMKKFLLFIMAVATISFVACSDDKDDQKNDELVGTIWVYSEIDSNYSLYESLSFESGSKCVYTIVEKESGATVIKENGKYSYTPPMVKIKISHDGQEVTKQLKISGNTMSDEDGYTFTKQEQK